MKIICFKRHTIKPGTLQQRTTEHGIPLEQLNPIKVLNTEHWQNGKTPAEQRNTPQQQRNTLKY